MLPLALLLASLSGALEIDEDPGRFVESSKAAPAKVHALILGAPWCPPCVELKKQLHERAASTVTAVGRAAWGYADTDALRDKVDALLKEMGASQPSSIPNVLVLRGGKAVGHAASGNDLASIEKFLAEVEAATPSADSELPSMLCPGRPDTADFTVGISGYLSERDASTDDFGRKVLLAFRSPAKPPRSVLLAPADRKPALDKTPSPGGEGYFYGRDLLAEHASLFAPVETASATLSDFDKTPGKTLRLILTGHAGETGMAYGYSDGGLPWKSPSLLAPKDIEGAVGAARLKGKAVRGLVVSCYAGQFADAFMPMPGASPACGAFATLPTKPAEGCYRHGGYATWNDYTTTVSKQRRCGSADDGRDRHYAVAATTVSRDVPMLSSEYFLIYGAAGGYLGRGARAPAPPRSIEQFDLRSGVSVFVDRLNGRVLAASQNGRKVRSPRLAVIGCEQQSWASMDRKRSGSAYLRGQRLNRFNEADCEPKFSFYWEPDDEEEAFPEEAAPDFGRPYEPSSSESYAKDTVNAVAGLVGRPVELPISGLRTEARVMLKVAMPAFERPMTDDELQKELQGLARSISPHDPPLARAIGALIAPARGARPAYESKLKTPALADAAVAVSESKAEEKASETYSGLAQFLVANTPLGSTAKEPAVSYFDADHLTSLMLANLNTSEIEAHEVALARLAHLVAVAKAELALRDEAKTSKKAQRLLAELEALKTCERALY